MLISHHFMAFLWAMDALLTIYLSQHLEWRRASRYIESIINSVHLWLTSNRVWNAVYDSDGNSDKDAERYPPSTQLMGRGTFDDRWYRLAKLAKLSSQQTGVRRSRRCWDFQFIFVLLFIFNCIKLSLPSISECRIARCETVWIAV